jgi:hypothetical protein
MLSEASRNASAASRSASRCAGPSKRGDKLINDGAPIRLWSDVGGNQALGLDAELGVDAEGGFEFGGSVDHGVSFGECGA